MMKRLITVVCASLLLSACASMPGQPSELSQRVDGTYMYSVEKNARRMGVRVEWVNPPLQKLEAPAPRVVTFGSSASNDDPDEN
ncbi:MAG: hypothetical protein AAGJ52_07080 [Pseudomonadota bacterium]